MINTTQVVCSAVVSCLNMYLRVDVRELQPETFGNNQFVWKIFVCVPIFYFL